MFVESVVSLLKETETRKNAVDILLKDIDTVWPEMVKTIPFLEKCFEDSKDNKEELSFLLSKIHFYLGDYDKAVFFMLKAPQVFQKQKKDLYTEKILSHIFDNTPTIKSEEEGENVLFEQENEENSCSALGFVVSCERIDWIEEIIKKQEDVFKTAKYVLRVLDGKNKQSILFCLNKIIREKIGKNKKENENILFFSTEISIALNDIKTIVSDLKENKKRIKHLLCLYIWKSCSSFFRKKIISELRKTMEEGSERTKMEEIISGQTCSKIEASFLQKEKKINKKTLKRAKDTLPQRNTLICAAIISSNAISCFGTKDDSFLRRNIEWLEYATNWAKFNAVASIGVVHSRDVENAKKILSEYLPKGDGSVTTNEYTEGGSLYSLGLISSRTYCPETGKYLSSILETVESQTVIHGASLGLGLCELGRGEKRLVDVLKGILYGDDCVSGPAAGVSIGLIMAGVDYSEETNETIQDLIAFASETAHDKLSHGVFLGISLMCTGMGDKIKKHSETLLNSRIPSSRIGGVLSLAAGYSGCYDNEVVKTLLNVISTDTENSVRRNATISLGFVMANRKEYLLEALSPLHQSFNPHVRYGSAIAAGIGLYGSGDEKVVKRIWELLEDTSDFVRQGAYIGLSMIVAGHTNKTSEHVDDLRQKIFSSIKSKYETNISRFGAIVGQGIIDCAGQNGLVSLLSQTSKPNIQKTIGLLLFTQYWEWLPFLHFISLSIETRGILAVNEDMELIDLNLKVDAPPSFFNYFKDTKTGKGKPQNVEMAILSTTARVMARSKEKINLTTDDLTEKEEEKEDSFYYKKNQSRLTLEEEKYINKKIDGSFCGVFILPEENEEMDIDH